MTSCKFYKTIGTYAQPYKNGAKITPKRFVIHSTGAANPQLKRWVNDPINAGINPNKNYFCGENDTREVMPHAVFGLDVNSDYAIIQILPYDVRPWGCGSGKNGSFNESAIQIEIAEPYDLEDEDYFFSAMNGVAEWCAELCTRYNISPNEIFSHKQAANMGFASNHGDPEHWFAKHNGYSMQDFRNKVCEWLEIQAIKSPETNNNSSAKNEFWRVQTGAFSTEIAARNYVKHLKNDFGIDAFVVAPK